MDDPGALALVRQPGSDGFRMDSSALFQVSVNVRSKNHREEENGVILWCLKIVDAAKYYLHTNIKIFFDGF